MVKWKHEQNSFGIDNVTDTQKPQLGEEKRAG